MYYSAKQWILAILFGLILGGAHRAEAGRLTSLECIKILPGKAVEYERTAVENYRRLQAQPELSRGVESWHLLKAIPDGGDHPQCDYYSLLMFRGVRGVFHPVPRSYNSASISVNRTFWRTVARFQHLRVGALLYLRYRPAGVTPSRDSLHSQVLLSASAGPYNMIELQLHAGTFSSEDSPGDAGLSVPQASKTQGVATECNQQSSERCCVIEVVAAIDF